VKLCATVAKSEARPQEHLEIFSTSWLKSSYADRRIGMR
jgi:hypothetical protein